MQSAARRVVLTPRFSSKRVINEASNAVLRSSTCWRGKSSAAPIPSSSFKQQKSQKRISQWERRAMVEAFVDQYRASNAGRFPSITLTKQQIGGCFYVVRRIIQELEYNEKVSLPKTAGQLEKIGKVMYSSSDMKEQPSLSKAQKSLTSSTIESCISDDQPTKFGVKSGMKVIDGLYMDKDPRVKDGERIELFEEKEPPISDDTEKALAEEPLSHLTAEVSHSSKQIVEDFENSRGSRQALHDAKIDIEVHSKDVPSRLANESRQNDDAASTESQGDTLDHIKLETRVDTLHSPSHNTKIDTVHLPDANDRVGGIKQKRSEDFFKSDKLADDDSRMLKEGASSTKRSGIWVSLKSLADGIISLWKKK